MVPPIIVHRFGDVGMSETIVRRSVLALRGVNEVTNVLDR